MDEDGNQIEDYSIVFRELFCVAAMELADQMNQPLENMGVLFDQIISSGHKIAHKGRSGQKSPSNSVVNSVDLERDGLTPFRFGRGQLLFLVRRVERKEAEHLQAAGFRFAGLQNVVDILARSIQIDRDELYTQLVMMREYAKEPQILEPGVHLACFAIRACLRGGFDVLVRKDARNQLPTMQLPLDTLDCWQVDYLAQMNNWSVAVCLKWLNAKATGLPPGQKEQVFASQLYDTLEALRDEINDTFFEDAQLISKAVSAPCRGFGDDASAKPSSACLIAFRCIIPIHSRASGNKLEYTPLTFLRMQQHVYKNSPDHAVFARKIHREFWPILNRARASISEVKAPAFSRARTQLQLDTSLPGLVKSRTNDQVGIKFWQRQRWGSHAERVKPDSSSEKGLVEANFLGGIMVSQEVSVDVRDKGQMAAAGRSLTGGSGLTSTSGLSATSKGPDMEMVEMGTTGVASAEVEDAETYVDELFAACIERRAER